MGYRSQNPSDEAVRGKGKPATQPICTTKPVGRWKLADIRQPPVSENKSHIDNTTAEGGT
jgi:hypothetical protein